MELKQLQIFAIASETLHFTHTAERLGYTQANVTLQIQQLEKELGGRLFERLGKKVSLTPMGKKLRSHALAILKSVNDAKAEIINNTGTLRIGAAESFCTYRLPTIFKTYKELYPDVQIVIVMLDCADYVSSLERDLVDIVCAVGDKINLSNCRVVTESKEPVSILSCPNHALAAKRRINAKDFTNESLLLTGEGCCYRRFFLNKLNDELIFPKISMETNSIQAIKQASISGIGICVLPDIAVRDELKAGTLVRLPVSDFKWNIWSQVLCHKDKWESEALRGFIEVIDTKSV